MAQIASAYPTAAGLYHWSSILGGLGWGWATAWFNMLRLIFVIASVNVGVYNLLSVLSSAIFSALTPRAGVLSSRPSVYGISPFAWTPMSLSVDEHLWADHGPDVVAPLAVYLFSDRASYLHGQMIRIADGRLSLFGDGSFGPTIGDDLSWTSDTLHAALQAAKLEELLVYHPVQSHSS